jgi:putative ABC transport system permease protein
MWMWRRRRALSKLDDDIRDHIARETEENVARGMSPDEGRRQALLKFGNAALAQEDTRAVWASVWLHDLVQDGRYALRTLAQNPGFALVAILTLGLGIGANVAIFSVVDAALFRPLPYHDPDSLVDVFITSQNPRGESVQIMAGGRHIERLRAIPAVFKSVDAYSDSHSRTLRDSDQRLWIGAITQTFPSFLGVSPQLGRAFDRQDVLAGNRMILSDSYWQSAFNRSPEVLGKEIAFADGTYIVIGVMPPTFRYFVGARAHGWVPLAEQDAGRLVARLRSGLSVNRAQEELGTALAAPETTWRPRGVEIVTGGWMRAGSTYSIRGRSTRAMLFGLLGAVGIVLAIACANVVNLLLARTFLRQQEIAVRGSLGATRVRLARQFLTEALVLSGLGSVAALLVAWWGLNTLPLIMPTELVELVFGASSASVDARVLAFSCAIALLAGSLCGAAPAIRASRSVLVGGALAGGRRIAGGSDRERRIRDAFQAVQVAMTVVLLAAAGLMLASLLRMIVKPAGFDPNNLGYASLTLPQDRSFDRTAFFDALIARTSTIPGMRDVTVGVSPVSGYSGAKFLVDERDPATAPPLEFFPVRPDYFRVAGITLKEGRLFGPEDHENTPLVAIISDAAANRFWPGQSPVGQQFRRFYPDEPPITIVGVVPSVKTIQLPRDGVEAYLPTAQAGEPPDLLFRFTGDCRGYSSAGPRDKSKRECVSR